MYCKKCGKEIKKESKFCNQCGNKVEVDHGDKKKLEKEKQVVQSREKEKFYCRNCGKKIDKNSNICPNCGYELYKRYCDHNNDSVENFFIYLVSLLIPFVGIVIWMISKDEYPKRAHTALVLSIVSTGILFVLFVLFILLMFLFIFSGIGGI